MLLWLFFILLFLPSLIHSLFGNITVEQLISNVQISVDGLMYADKEIFNFVTDYLFHKTLYSAVLTFGFFATLFYVCRSKKAQITSCIINLKSKKKRAVFLSFQRILYQIQNWKTYIIILLFIMAIMGILKTISFDKYILHQSNSDFIDNNYVPPQNIKAPVHKRNLVLIYVESLEDTYSKKDIFGKDLLAPINNDSQKAISFKNYQQVTGTSWSIAGQVSTLCGVPLKPLNHFIKRNGMGVMDKFMPNITCLGDVLKSHGYKNVYMIATSMAFAGQGKFFQEHGYDELYGSSYWLKKGILIYKGWGIYDNVLMSEAKSRLSTLEKGDSPFNLTFFLLDTHGPYGSLSKDCKSGRKSKQDIFKDVLRCDAELLRDFIAFMADQKYFDNTDLVIIGDHLAMGNPLMKLINKNPERRIFNKFISTAHHVKNRESIIPFDIFPTILNFMGFQFAENRLGLGTSAFGEVDKKHGLYNVKKLNEQLSMNSLKYLSFWKAEDKS